MGIYRFVEILRDFGVSSYYLAATTRVHPTPCVSIGTSGDFEKVWGVNKLGTDLAGVWERLPNITFYLSKHIGGNFKVV